MRKIYKFSLCTLLLITLTNAVFAQNRFFQDAGENKIVQTTGKREIFPNKYAGFVTDINALKSFLWTLPSEKNIINNRNLAPIMEIPMPNGKTARFRVWESNVMESGLAAKLPEMRHR